jgi:hypothetical protein
MVLPVEIERRFGSAFHPYLEGAWEVMFSPNELK